ncbi:MAG: CzcE family metal-binding protein [Gallionella sp.]|nr:CzcE family metal-binding protein [Gallionella sp.]
MKTTLTKIALIASLSAIGTTAAMAHEDYSESGSVHWLQHVSESKGQPTANQLVPYGYQSTGAAARVVSIDAGTKYLNVTRLETVQIKAGVNTVTWMFDTLGTAPFPLSKIIPGTDGVMVYVAENPAYIGG